MAIPSLTPTSSVNSNVLTSTGSSADVVAALPFGVYTRDTSKNDYQEFLSGAVAQVSYTYKKLGGDVLDIELSPSIVYANYEEACLEYSYIVNIHQSKNTLGSVLGETTGSFDYLGEIKEGDLSGSHLELRLPRYNIGYAVEVGDAFSHEAGVGGTRTMYSASFDRVVDQQDYDLNTIIKNTAETDTNSPFYNKVKNNKITIRHVYYKSPRQMWRFYGYYGGLNVTGDFHTYGQYADDSTFEVIPAWQNKLQAVAYEDHLYTRTSHYSYEIINNQLRLFPVPDNVSPENFWVRFSIATGSFGGPEDERSTGINNMNTLPFENIPYQSINSIGKQWIRRFALALSKETLGQIRSKFGDNIPIPGETLTLNGKDLLSQAQTEQKDLREELKSVLDEMTYAKLIETDAAIADNSSKIQEKIPLPVFVG